MDSATYDGDGDSFDIPANAELGADILIPALIGFWNPGVGVGAALALAVDDFAENMEPDDGGSPLPNGGRKYRKSNGYWDPSHSSVAYTQRFTVRHGYDEGADFEVRSEIWDRINDRFDYSMQPSVDVSGSAFTGGDAMYLSSLSEETPTSDLGSLDPEEMTQEERDRYGIKKVAPSDRAGLAEKLSTEADEVRWVVT